MRITPTVAWMLGVMLVGLNSDAANLTLQNPAFETLPNSATDWALTGGAARSQSSVDTHGYVLVFAEDVTPYNTWAAASQTLVAAPGQQWTLSAWVLQPTLSTLHPGDSDYSADFALLEIKFTTGSGTSTTFQSAHFDTAALGSDDKWRKLTYVAEAPSDTIEATVSARFYHADPWRNGRIFFDDFSAEVSPVPEPYVVWAVVPVIVLAIWRQRRLSARRA